MKTLITTLLLLVSTPGFSQKDTTKLPISVARKIAVELLACDSIKAVLKSTEQELDLCKADKDYKDSLLNSASLRFQKLNTRFQVQKSLSESYKTLYTDTKAQYNSLASELKRVRGNKAAVEIGGGLVILSLLYILILK